MLTLTTRTTPGSLTLAVVVIVAVSLILFNGAAWAGKVVLSGTYSQTSIMTSCSNAGGNFHSDDSGFGCTTSKGSVNCGTNGKCTGECASCGSAAIMHKGGAVFGVLSGVTQKTGANIPAPYGPRSGRNLVVAAPATSYPILERHERHSNKKL